MARVISGDVFAPKEMSPKAQAVKDAIRARYGENKRIEGDYDKSLSAKCVNGTFVGRKNGDVLEFRGIPFVGEQPVGKNRFKKPVPYKADEGVYEAYYYGKVCCQPEVPADEGSLYYQGEDCLYVNIFNNQKDPSRKKPVMFWIHGGAWEHGGTADPFYDGHNFVDANPDVILVTTSYRVNLFGFIELRHLPGGEAYPDAQNAGILDQMMALKWVHENIAAFGGDPDNVTVFGQSAGGGSTSDLLLIPEARQYFRRAIPISGSVGLTRTREMAEEFTKCAMEIMGISTIEELVNISTDKIVEGSLAKVLRTFPERDGTLIPQEPFAYMRSEACKDVEVLQGTTKDEMNFFIYGMDGDRELFTNTFKAMFEDKAVEVGPEQARLVGDFLEKAGKDLCEQVSIFGTQNMFNAPALRQSEELAAAGAKVYHYFYRVESDLPDMPGLGAMHSVDLTPLLNNLDVKAVTGRDIDKTFARTMQRMFVNFAKNGNPSLTAEESPSGKAITWEPYNSEKKPVMVFDEFDIHMSDAKSLNIIDWDSMYPLTDYYLFLSKD